MALHTTAKYSCDRCQEKYMMDKFSPVARSDGEAYNAAVDEGWVISPSEDLCPECVKERERGDEDE